MAYKRRYKGRRRHRRMHKRHRKRFFNRNKVAKKIINKVHRRNKHSSWQKIPRLISNPNTTLHRTGNTLNFNWAQTAALTGNGVQAVLWTLGGAMTPSQLAWIQANYMYMQLIGWNCTIVLNDLDNVVEFQNTGGSMANYAIRPMGVDNMPDLYCVNTSNAVQHTTYTNNNSTITGYEQLWVETPKVHKFTKGRRKMVRQWHCPKGYEDNAIATAGRLIGYSLNSSTFGPANDQPWGGVFLWADAPLYLNAASLDFMIYMDCVWKLSCYIPT